MATEEGIAVVTGAAQGIGKTIANYLLSQGYKVFLLDIVTTLGNNTCKEFQKKYGETKVSYIHCDVSDTDSFTDAFNEVLKICGHISVMVNNAGVLDEHNVQRCININLTGAIFGSNLAIKNMRKDKGGNGGIIVNIASMSGLGSYYHVPTYCATKCGLIGFTKSWAVSILYPSIGKCFLTGNFEEAHPTCDDLGLTFMCICPGFVDTQLARHGASMTLDPSRFEAPQAFELLPLQTIQDAFAKLLKEKQNGSVLEASIKRIGYLTNTFPAAEPNETENS